MIVKILLALVAILCVVLTTDTEGSLVLYYDVEPEPSEAPTPEPSQEEPTIAEEVPSMTQDMPGDVDCLLPEPEEKPKSEAKKVSVTVGGKAVNSGLSHKKKAADETVDDLRSAARTVDPNAARSQRIFDSIKGKL